MRRHSLDNLRWAAALLVFAYHICYLYNGLGIPGGIPGAESQVCILQGFEGAHG